MKNNYSPPGYSFKDLTLSSLSCTAAIAFNAALAPANVVTYGIPNSIANLLMI